MGTRIIFCQLKNLKQFFYLTNVGLDSDQGSTKQKIRRDIDSSVLAF